MKKKIDYEQCGKYAAILSLTEIGLGGFLHSFKIPFSGHSLSLNQAFILTYAKLKLSNTNHLYSSLLISNSTALLKSLSPAGKKLTPMLAISAQGNIHGITTIILGTSKLSLIIANIFLSLWAFIQPLAIYLILFGKDLFYMLQYFVSKLEKVTPVTTENVLNTIAILVAIKIVLSILVSLVAFNYTEKQLSLYLNFIKKYKSKPKASVPPLKGAVKDLLSPLFLSSSTLMMIFYYFSKSDLTQIILFSLRPFAVGLIFFYLIRKFSFEEVVEKLRKTPFRSLAEVLNKAIIYIKEI